MKIKFWTKKANKNINNCYCDYYLKDKDMMEELGVTTNSQIEYEINNGDFSCLIDTLGDYESIMHKYRITSFEQLEKIISFYFNAKKLLKGN